MKEIYISTDIEAVGPIPGPHSMLSIGAAAYTADKVPVSTFSANLETLPGAQAHPKTAELWAKQPEAWAASRKELELPEPAMTRYVTWIKSLDGKPVFVAYPAAYDFMFVYWYLIKYVRESPFSHSALDIATVGPIHHRAAASPGIRCNSSFSASVFLFHASTAFAYALSMRFTTFSFENCSSPSGAFTTFRGVSVIHCFQSAPTMLKSDVAVARIGRS
jgi:hypothetical protein